MPRTCHFTPRRLQYVSWNLPRSASRDGNLNAISDALSGAAMARAALTAAGYNVRINLYDHPDKATVEEMLDELWSLKPARTSSRTRSGKQCRGGRNSPDDALGRSVTDPQTESEHMGLKPDHWIRRMALEHRMIEPFNDAPGQQGRHLLRRFVVRL